MRADNRQMDKVTSIGRFESKTPRVKKRLYEKGNIHTFCIYDWIDTFLLPPLSSNEICNQRLLRQGKGRL